MKKNMIKKAGTFLIIGMLLLSYNAIAENADDKCLNKEIMIEELTSQLYYGSPPSSSDKTPGVGYFSSIALDSDQYPHISYADYGNGNLNYIYWGGAEWTIQTVDDGEDVGYSTSIAIDENDHPHISYLDFGNFDLKYASWSGSTWMIETVDSQGDVGYQTSMDLDSDGNPHISYVDVTNLDLKYATWTGSDWIIETIDTGYIVHKTSIAVDSEDNPHIAYDDYITGNLKYASYTGTSWYIEVVDDDGPVGIHTALALDGNDVPHISYHNGNNGFLMYAYYNDEQWKTASIDWLDDDKPTGKYTSIKLDSNDMVHISYLDQDSADLKYIYQDESGWRDAICIDSEQSVGYYTSLQIDSDDQPHISYLDIGHENLKYACFKDNDWNIETIDSCKHVNHIDQQSTSFCGIGLMTSSGQPALAQSFIPEFDTLFKIEVPLWVRGDPGGVTISIRRNLDDEDIASDYLPREGLPTDVLFWYTFDFGEMSLNAGKTYYIVWRVDDFSSSDNFFWPFGYSNPYQEGTAWAYRGSWDTVAIGYDNVDFCFKTFVPNNPPNKPSIDGPSSARAGSEVSFILSATDPEGDDVFFCIDWGDESEEICLGPFQSDVGQTISHMWSEKGDYQIQVKAQDEYQAESDYATFAVSMPKTKMNVRLFLRLFENKPLLFPLLHKLLLYK